MGSKIHHRTELHEQAVASVLGDLTYPTVVIGSGTFPLAALRLIPDLFDTMAIRAYDDANDEACYAYTQLALRFRRLLPQ